MKTHTVRFVILLLLGLGAGLAHGVIGGLKMPEKPEAGVPKAPPRVQSEDADTPVSPESSVPVESAEVAGGGGEISEELLNLHEHFLNGTAIILDARTRDEYVEGHIPGSFHAPFEAFIGQVPDYMDLLLGDPGQLIIIYCGGGDCHASESVGAKLKEFGLESVFVFESGYPAWVDAGFEVEQGEGMW